MSITTAIFGLRGRIGRAAYLGYNLVSISVAIFIIGLVVYYRINYGYHDIMILILFPTVMIYSWTLVAISVKRFHDTNRTGGVLFLVPLLFSLSKHLPMLRDNDLYFAILLCLVAGSVGLWLACTPGTAGTNRFGPAPGTDEIKEGLDLGTESTWDPDGSMVGDRYQYKGDDNAWMRPASHLSNGRPCGTLRPRGA